MRELQMFILAELRGAWRYRWQAIGVAWLVCLLGWFVVLVLPDRYESFATVYVNTSSPLWESLKGIANQNDILERVEVETKSLQSRPELEEVAREVDLHLRADNDQSLGDIVSYMQRNVNIGPVSRREPNQYLISFTDTDPKMAQDVVSTLLTSFVEESLGATRTDSQKTQAFYREQLDKVAAELTQSEQALAEFKKNNVGRMPGQAGGYFDRLQGEMVALDAVEAKLRLAERRRDKLREQITGTSSEGETGGGIKSELDDRIEQNRARLEELQIRFTDRHPDVIAVKSTIAELEEQKSRQLEQLASDDANIVSSTNPVFQAIQLDLSAVNVEIAGLEEERRTHERRIKQYESLVDVLPQVEAELTRLNRDYDVKQTQYNALLTRLEQAELSESAEASQDARFRIIDPPLLPRSPAAPNRILLIAAVLAGGLGCGVALAVLRSQLNPVFTDVHSLREYTGFPVLGVVQAIRTPGSKQRRVRQVLGVTLATASLCVVFLMVLLFEQAGGQTLRAVIT